MCEIHEIKVISWDRKWERIEAGDFGVRLTLTRIEMPTKTEQETMKTQRQACVYNDANVTFI